MVVVDDIHEFPLRHPYEINLTLYRRAKDPEDRYFRMKRVHDILWPHFAKTWHYWDERRFRAHCGDWEQIVLAGGASIAKSHAIARAAIIFWLADPDNRACIIASTTLESLEGRIWGYVNEFITNTAVPVNARVLGGKPPKILTLDGTGKMFGMFAAAVRSGDDDKTIGTVIGRHPSGGLLVILDEATEMNPLITKAVPNLRKGIKVFQIWAIGNSSSKSDLHGAMATPKVGWENIDPEVDWIWETQNHKGICLYFHPKDSPAIHEKDPERKEALSVFLPTEKSLEEDKQLYGEGSDSYWRFTLGFWKSAATDAVIVSEEFVTEHDIQKSAEWSGFLPLNVVAGLDPAFSRGGAGCILRIAYLGVDVNGLVCLDFRMEELLFKIDVRIDINKDGEQQLAEGVIRKLEEYQCPLENCAVDVTGGGRPFASLIRVLKAGSPPMIKISSVGRSSGLAKAKKDPEILVATPTDLWIQMREFIVNRQIKSLDPLTVSQLVNRRVEREKRFGAITLETKDAFKARMGAINPKLARSPDEADAAILAVHAAIVRFGFTEGQRREVPKMDREWINRVLTIESQKREKIQAMDSRIGGGAKQVTLVPNFACDISDLVKVRPE